jgi:hypothetical protein
VPVLRRARVFQLLEVPGVHGQQQVEAVEVRSPDLARTVARQIISAQLRVLRAAVVGRRAHVVVGRACRSDVHPVPESGLLQLVPQHGFRRRASADVAGAD